MERAWPFSRALLLPPAFAILFYQKTNPFPRIFTFLQKGTIDFTSCSRPSDPFKLYIQFSEVWKGGLVGALQ
jgi:hypothetical protein